KGIKKFSKDCGVYTTCADRSGRRCAILVSNFPTDARLPEAIVRDEEPIMHLSLQRHLYAHVLKHKEIKASKKPLTLIANYRKPAILHGQILATHPSDVVGLS